MSKSFKKKFKEWCEDSDFKIAINFTRWRRRFDIGRDPNDSFTQIFWVFIDFGPFEFKFAPSHWDQWS